MSYTNRGGYPMHVEPLRIKFVAAKGSRPKCDEHIVEIRRGLADGKTIVEIAKAIGVSRGALQSFCRKYRFVKNKKLSLRLPGYPGEGALP